MNNAKKKKDKKRPPPMPPMSPYNIVILSLLEFYKG